MSRIIATKVVPRVSALGSNGAFCVNGLTSQSHLTRSPAQKPACKDLGRNGKDRHHAQGHLHSGF
ncbi:hypothetical protein FD51_GL001666 [Lacticaseibacillus zeae DSM 20178 = KCTC 3804]|uniref:Alpha-galactosidase n=1 Tax=Lacticaseibacillus zeae DSM 20178 = KCTC 3804 TaxID=1423816 RepID=A0A0R1EMX8_LACZE|nr:hypothetical protein FD51_GL001666 [Lacticaseibacillus zeae DSM 20178 = KCTC 3804]